VKKTKEKMLGPWEKLKTQAKQEEEREVVLTSKTMRDMQVKIKAAREALKARSPLKG